MQRLLQILSIFMLFCIIWCNQIMLKMSCRNARLTSFKLDNCFIILCWRIFFHLSYPTSRIIGISLASSIHHVLTRIVSLYSLCAGLTGVDKSRDLNFEALT